MKRIPLLFLLTTCAITQLIGQTLSETQRRNARATGYAIVAARNPGKSFSIYMIPWDGVNSLEQNANTQINSGWHAQAAVKGNFFHQEFNGNDFSRYSSVVLSQAEFDQYKNTGTEWWIVCSTLPPFSNSSITVNENGFVGIGVPSAEVMLAVQGDIRWGNNSMLKIDQGSAIEMRGTGSPYIDLSNDGAVDYDARFILYADDVLTLDGANLGIGTNNPGTYKLAVEGKIGAREVVITTSPWADYVFEPGYELLPLSEVAKFIRLHKHLPEVPTTEDVNKNGVNVGEINALLLKKIEELTLYLLEQKEINDQQQKMIENLAARLKE